MKQRLTLKDHETEQHLFKKRVWFCLFIVLLCATGLIIRLVYLQIYYHEHYTTLSNQNQLTLVPLEPARGLIFDRNGILLAENSPTFSLELIPEKINNILYTIQRLRAIIPISDEEIKVFKRQSKQLHRYESIPIRLKLTEDEMAAFAVNQFKFPGVVVKPHLTRNYPMKEIMTSALGYVSRINIKELQKIDKVNYSASQHIGKTGLEKYYEDILHGQVGYQQIETDASGRTVRILKRIPPVPGENLYLTIDSKLQNVVAKAFGDEKGAFVAIDPSNGEVLALVSSPSFDPNLFTNGIDSKTYKALQTAENKPLYNRAVRGLYPPASTFKPYMALLGLALGTINEHDTVYDPGTFQLRNSSHVYRDWRPKGHGSVNVFRAIVVSCDVFFYTLGTRIGVEKIATMMKQFGFGAPTGIEIPEEHPGLVATPQWKKKKMNQIWYPGDTVITSIGQGFTLVSPLQLAQAIAIMANKGQHYQIHLLHHRQAANGTITPYVPKKLATIDYPQSAWDLVHEGMRNVVVSPEGTGARRFGDAKYSVAAKTGTAQIIRKPASVKDGDQFQKTLAKRFRNHSLLVAFAPVDKPKIALAIIVENNIEGRGAQIARIATDYFFFRKEPEELAAEEAQQKQQDDEEEIEPEGNGNPSESYEEETPEEQDSSNETEDTETE